MDLKWLYAAVLATAVATVVAQNDGDLRLADGTEKYNGRVEVYYGGQWGTICDKKFGIADANMVCRNVGFSGAESADNGATYGEGTGIIQMTKLACRAGAADIFECIDPPDREWGKNNCDHSRDAGVTCTVDEPAVQPPEPIIAVEPTPAPIVAVGAGQTVQPQEATPAPIVAVGAGQTVQPQIAVLPPPVEVIETTPEPQVAVQPPPVVVIEPPPAPEAADGDLRLADGTAPNNGRVEVYYGGQWGTICDKKFGIADANMVCRNVGYTGAVSADNGAAYGEGTGIIQMTKMACRAGAPDIFACIDPPDREWGKNNCDHSMDAGVTCIVPGEVEAAGCNEEPLGPCYEKYDDMHISHGDPMHGVQTACECGDLCKANATCAGFDFNYDMPPYLGATCWIHDLSENEDFVVPDMTVAHFRKIC